MRMRVVGLFSIALISLACASDPTQSPDGSGGDAGGTGGVAGNSGPSEVTFTIDSSKAHAISPYIYGTNSGDFTKEAKGLTLARVGGNRLTAYNWENNLSNAGSDWNYSSDNYLSKSTTPGAGMTAPTQAASAASASMIMTVPIAGWVSAKANSACPAKPTAAQIAENFFPILPKKSSAFAYPPDLTDGKVYADEFVAYMESQFPSAQTDPSRRIFYMLDNEPDIWAETHGEIHPDKVTYAELVQKSTDFASGIKGAAPKALVFGPVNYGWQGMVDLQKATDAAGRDFLEFYLDAMKAAEQTAGQRLLDVLDVHWYPEAQGDGKRINDDGITAGEVEARLQAPRSLWDKSYKETSWIADAAGVGPIYLLPRLQAKIDQHYPGTKLSISEYNYGAGGDISGGIAQADVLGVYGREGLFAASVWLMSSTSTFLYAGFAMYRNYDGNGATFGDTSIAATTSAVDATSVYASVFAQNPTNVVVVAINKTTGTPVANITLTHPTQLTAADVYTLTSASATPAKSTALAAVSPNVFSYSMPARSVSTLVLRP